MNDKNFEKFIPEPNSGCWLWIGRYQHQGYGVMYISKTKRTMAHRAFYAHFCGPVSPELLVCHKCDNPSCVNPDHLFLGTNKDNTQDMLKKGRHKFGLNLGEKHGKTKLTEQQVREIKVSPLGLSACARKYGTNPHTVYDIRTGRRWGHLFEK